VDFSKKLQVAAKRYTKFQDNTKVNVIFHTTTAISVTVLLTDIKRIEQSTTSSNDFKQRYLDKYFGIHRWTYFTRGVGLHSALLSD
jgi:hypothetical protein